MKLILGNKNYSSWSLRPWIAMKALGIPFDEIVIPFGEPIGNPEFKAKVRQYSPALAGVVIATNASASIAEAGVAAIFKNGFILFFLFWFKSGRARWDAGSVSATDARKKQRLSPLAPAKDQTASPRGLIEV